MKPNDADTEKLQELQKKMAENGHGHIYPRADGEKINCGGVAVCEKCFDEGRHYARALHRAKA